MNRATLLSIAVDALGGDHAPDVVLEGVTLALAEDDELKVQLVGPSDLVQAYAAPFDRVEPVVATEVIAMDEHPAAAVRTKRDSSIVVGCRLVREGSAAGFFSAGSTGACMAAGTLVIGRIPGVLRPGLATVVPTAGRPCILVDIGANADCKPENLVQFALMGRVYSEVALGVSDPTVALLNIGEEPTKGSQLALEAYAAMREQVPGFVGNVEGRDIPVGGADVIVTDGFTGNVALKLMEGLSKTLLTEVKDAMTSSAMRTAAAAVLRQPLLELKERLNPDRFGGAPLLGVNGACIIGHGSSNATAVANGIRVCARVARGGLAERIAAVVATSAS